MIALIYFQLSIMSRKINMYYYYYYYHYTYIEYHLHYHILFQVTSDGMIKSQVNLPSLTLTPGGASVSVSVRLPTFQKSSAFYVLVEPGYTVVKSGLGAVMAAPKMQATSVLAIVVSLIMSAVVLVN